MKGHHATQILLCLAFAREVLSQAYAPNSASGVGAASMPAARSSRRERRERRVRLTICAERAAALAAVTAGYTEFDAIAVVGDSDSPTVPCGACRQFLAEFNPEMRVILGGKTDAVEVTSLDELLPDAFVRGYLDQDDGEDEE